MKEDEEEEEREFEQMHCLLIGPLCVMSRHHVVFQLIRRIEQQNKLLLLTAAVHSKLAISSRHVYSVSPLLSAAFALSYGNVILAKMKARV